jgi:hypothetical protein
MVKTKEVKAAEVNYILKDVMGLYDTSLVPGCSAHEASLMLKELHL